MKRCDVCHEGVSDLMPLSDEFSDGDMKDICKACDKTISNAMLGATRALDRIKQRARGNLFTRFVSIMRGGEDHKI